MPATDTPLAGRTIAVPETRQLDALAQMLEDLGATPLRCPLVAILDAPDPAPIETFLRQLASGDFDDLILLTGEGLRRLLGFARRAGLYDSVVAALPLVRKIVRGPKPAKALTEIGLHPDLAAEAPTTEGVIATLAREQLVGRRAAVQLYGQDPNERLISFLRKAGASRYHRSALPLRSCQRRRRRGRPDPPHGRRGRGRDRLHQCVAGGAHLGRRRQAPP